MCVCLYVKEMSEKRKREREKEVESMRECMRVERKREMAEKYTHDTNRSNGCESEHFKRSIELLLYNISGS